MNRIKSDIPDALSYEEDYYMRQKALDEKGWFKDDPRYLYNGSDKENEDLTRFKKRLRAAGGIFSYLERGSLAT